MIEKYELDFCFKGSRNYVHGTDIYNTLIKLFEAELKNSKIDLSFHGVAKTNMDLILEKPQNEKLIKFAFKYKHKDIQTVWYAIENNNKIECRYEYPEEQIYEVADLDIENNRIFIEKDTEYSFIENTVALNKYLLENLFPDIEGKWYFTRIQLDKATKKKYPLKLELKANFNFKLTKTAISIDNELIGYIYFSMV